jgi:hypothetical protein
MLIVKIFDNHSKQERLHKVDSMPCLIGRSLQNNLIIDDDSISATHAKIDSDKNGIYLKDLKSTNGVTVNNVPIDQQYIHENTYFMFGEVKLEIILDDEDLEKTRVIEIPDKFDKRSARDQKRNIIISICLINILILLDKFIIAPLRKDDIPKLLLEVFGSIFILSTISLLTSVISKVHSKKYKLISFLEAFSVILVILCFHNFLKSYISFYSNNRVFSKIIDVIFYSVMIYGSCYSILTIFFRNQHKKTIKVIIGTFYIGFILFTFISNTFNERDLKFDFISSFELSPFSYQQEEYPFASIKSKITKSFEELDELRTDKNKKKAIELEEYRNVNP